VRDLGRSVRDCRCGDGSRLTEARGGSLDTALTREALANPPKECSLYQAEEPDLKEAATDWTYDLWVRETMRRRLPVG
jgi:hypothetical protein